MKFLISLDVGGKTIVHTPYCPRSLCNCPPCIAAGTVKSFLEKLRAIFTAHGRLGHENPVTLPIVKRYLSFTQEEQAAAAVLPHQAIPFRPEKLITLINYLYTQLTAPTRSPLQRYLFIRDIAFFVVDFFTGDRASDLGRLQTHTVFKLSDQRGYLLNFTFGKTLRGANTLTRPFILLPAATSIACPVSWLSYYFEYCTSMG